MRELYEDFCAFSKKILTTQSKSIKLKPSSEQNVIKTNSYKQQKGECIMGYTFMVPEKILSGTGVIEELGPHIQGKGTKAEN